MSDVTLTDFLKYHYNTQNDIPYLNHLRIKAAEIYADSQTENLRDVYGLFKPGLKAVGKHAIRFGFPLGVVISSLSDNSFFGLVGGMTVGAIDTSLLLCKDYQSTNHK